MKDLERKIYKHLKDRNWHNLHPGDLAKSIMIEGAELLELFQWDSPSLAEVKKDKEKMEEIKGEVADIMIYAIEMSVLLGFDTEKVIKNKLEISGKKYPAKLMRTVKEGVRQSEYWKIKKAHRKSKN